MKTSNKKIQWLPTLLIVWNLIDIAVHIVVDMVEPLRVSGNIVGIVAALIVWFGLAKPFAPHILGGAAVLVVLLNALHASEHGYAIPMLVFIGVALFLLLRWAQVLIAKDADQRLYHRWWAALAIAVIGAAIVVYMPGISEVYRYRWENQSLVLDEDWGFVSVTEEDDLGAMAPNVIGD